MAAKKIITAQLMEDLFIDAMGGDSVALNEYRSNARLLAKRSNQQMLEQERRDITGEAYRRAQFFLGGDMDDERGARFRENVARSDIMELRAQVDEMLSFTSARDYNIKYAAESREQIDRLLEPLAAAGIDVEDARVTFWMNELFKTGAWKEYKKAHGNSTNLIQAAQEQFAQGKTVDDLLDAYNAYTSDQDDMDLVQSWESFAPGSW